MPITRTKLSQSTKIEALTEAGFRCAVPACRNILAIDIHHIDQVREGGGNDLSNLIVLCPNCHALYHRGTITKDAIYIWKALLVSLNQAFDRNTIEDLLFLSKLKDEKRHLGITGDGVLKFSKLIASGLASFEYMRHNGPIEIYEVHLSPKGVLLVDAWKKGDREAVNNAINGIQEGEGDSPPKGPSLRN